MTSIPLPETPTPIGERHYKKWLIIGAAVLLLISAILAITLSGTTASPTQQQPTPTPITRITAPTRSPAASTPTILSPELKKAIEEAQQSAKSYDAWVDTNRATYPWIRRFPITAESFFAYFDLQKKSYIIHLYAKPGQSIAALKQDTAATLQAMGFPMSSFPIEWSVLQK